MAARLAGFGIVVLTGLGWAVVGYAVLALPVSPGSQAVFYTAGLVALTGTVAMLLHLYQSRRSGSARAEGAVRFLGTGMRLGLAVEFALWLQSLRMLTVAYVVFIGAGFLFVEFLFQQSGDRGRPDATR